MTRGRLLLLAAGGASLVVGLWLGLSRLGMALPPLAAVSTADHGPLMVSGFLGTVIALERAVAHRAAWGFLFPALNAAGVLATLAVPGGAGEWLWLLGSLGVVVIMTRVLRVDFALHHVLMTLAALAWCVGNVLLLAGVPVFDLVAWWVAFLVLTIGAERLELSRLLRPGPLARAVFLVAAGLLVAGPLVGFASRDLSFRVLGAGALVLAGWLAQHDVARRTVRQRGPVRFIAWALLFGYLWLAVGGILAMVWGHPIAGPRYDAILHAWFVGFVFSMILGHALVIVPAVLNVAVTYRPRFYVHLALLHASLALRVVGDVAGSGGLRASGAWLNVMAIALFLVSTVSSVRRLQPANRAGQ